MIYIVYFNGYSGWGVKYYLFAVLDSKEKVEEKIKRSGYDKNFFQIKEIRLNTIFEIYEAEDERLMTDMYLGGYWE